MTVPPMARVTGRDASHADAPPAALSYAPVASSLPVETLRQRADFLRAAQARRRSTPGFTLQARHRADDTPAIRVGFTCSRKIGNAVLRNRAKRRLRAVVREILPGLGRGGWDYVLVGRPGATVDRAYADLCDDLRQALGHIHESHSHHQGRPK